MYTQFYSEVSTMAMDYWFDKNVAVLSISPLMTNGEQNGRRYDYNNSVKITMNLIEIEKAIEHVNAILNNIDGNSFNYNQPILVRRWNNDITEFYITFIDGTPGVMIKAILYENPIIMIYKFNDIYEVRVFKRYLTSILNVCPMLGSYYYWIRYMNNKQNKSNNNNQGNWNNNNQNRNNNQQNNRSSNNNQNNWNNNQSQQSTSTCMNNNWNNSNNQNTIQPSNNFQSNQSQQSNNQFKNIEIDNGDVELF